MSGFQETRTQLNKSGSLGSLLGSIGGGTGKNAVRTKQYKFLGALSGRTCKFKLETSTHEDPPAYFDHDSDSTIDGYIIFAEDGNSGEVAEVKEGKPEKYYKIQKVTT
jgi:hypothetical protein